MSGLETLGDFVVATTARGALVIAVAAAATWITRGSAAALRRAIGCASVVALVGLAVAPIAPTTFALPLAGWSQGAVVPQPKRHVSHDPWEAALSSPAQDPFPSPAPLPAVPLRPALALVWLVGALATAAPFLRRSWRLRSLLHRAVPVGDRVVSRLALRARRRIGIRREVRILEANVPAPLATGILRPAIVLPPGATQWPMSRMWHVLAHEMAHIARNDGLWLGVARIGRAIHWMDPLAWRAVRRLEHALESASDEFALQQGIPGRDYARTLVDTFTDALRAAGPRPALSMASTATPLEARIREALRGPRPRPPWARCMLATAGVVVVGALLATTSVTLAERAACDEAEPTVAASAAGGEATSLLDAALFDPDPAARREAICALGRVGDDRALSHLARLWESRDPRAARAAAWAMDQIEARIDPDVTEAPSF